MERNAITDYRVAKTGLKYSRKILVDWYSYVPPVSSNGYNNFHRVFCELFNGPCPEGMHCMHLDSDKTNNAASNLKWGTPSENILEMKKRTSSPEKEAMTRTKMWETRRLNPSMSKAAIYMRERRTKNLLHGN